MTIDDGRVAAGALHFAAVDIAQREQVQAWAKQVLSRSGAPDLLINNASLINQRAPLWAVPAAEFDQILAVNVTGVAHVLQAFLPAMLKTGHSIIVNISSSWGRQASAGLAPYCASKFAIEGLTQVLALELPAGLAAIALDPGGGINTEMLHACLGAEAEQYQSPQDWAIEAVPFMLALSAADNGKALTVEKSAKEVLNKSRFGDGKKISVCSRAESLAIGSRNTELALWKAGFARFHRLCPVSGRTLRVGRHQPFMREHEVGEAEQ